MPSSCALRQLDAPGRLARSKALAKKRAAAARDMHSTTFLAIPLLSFIILFICAAGFIIIWPLLFTPLFTLSVLSVWLDTCHRQSSALSSVKFNMSNSCFTFLAGILQLAMTLAIPVACTLDM